MYEKLINRLKNLATLDVPTQKVYGGARITTTSVEAIECIQELAQEAADAIEKLQKAVNFHKFNSEIWEDKYNSLADKKWISVTERLPEYGQWVLCMCRAEIIDVLKYCNGIAGPWYKDSRHVFMKSFVTHWMPLPKPPKEDKP